MIKVDELIKELSKFPGNARLEVGPDKILVHPPSKTRGALGRICCKYKGRRSETTLGYWGVVGKACVSAGDRIRRWLRLNPQETFSIALTAVAGLYLEEDYDTALPEEYSNPRGDGGDYIDEVGRVILGFKDGLMPLIETLQAEVECEEEDEDE